MSQPETLRVSAAARAKGRKADIGARKRCGVEWLPLRFQSRSPRFAECPMGCAHDIRSVDTHWRSLCCGIEARAGRSARAAGRNSSNFRGDIELVDRPRPCLRRDSSERSPPLRWLQCGNIPARWRTSAPSRTPWSDFRGGARWRGYTTADTRASSGACCP